jgi:hypothetical protein
MPTSPARPPEKDRWPETSTGKAANSSLGRAQKAQTRKAVREYSGSSDSPKRHITASAQERDRDQPNRAPRDWRRTNLHCVLGITPAIRIIRA